MHLTSLAPWTATRYAAHCTLVGCLVVERMEVIRLKGHATPTIYF